MEERLSLRTVEFEDMADLNALTASVRKKSAALSDCTTDNSRSVCGPIFK